MTNCLRALGLFVLLAVASIAFVPAPALADNMHKKHVDGTASSLTDGLKEVNDAKPKGRWRYKSNELCVFCTSALWSECSADAVTGAFCQADYHKKGGKPVTYVSASFALETCDGYGCYTSFEEVDPANVSYEGGVLTMAGPEHYMECTGAEDGHWYKEDLKTRWSDSWDNSGAYGSDYESHEAEVSGVSHPYIPDSYLQEYLQIRKTDQKSSGGKN